MKSLMFFIKNQNQIFLNKPNKIKMSKTFPFGRINPIKDTSIIIKNSNINLIKLINSIVLKLFSNIL